MLYTKKLLIKAKRWLRRKVDMRHQTVGMLRLRSRRSRGHSSNHVSIQGDKSIRMQFETGPEPYLRFSSKAVSGSRGLIVTIQFFDKQFSELVGDDAGLFYSPRFGWFHFIPPARSSENPETIFFELAAPAGCSYVKATFMNWGDAQSQILDVGSIRLTQSATRPAGHAPKRTENKRVVERYKRKVVKKQTKLEVIKRVNSKRAYNGVAQLVGASTERPGRAASAPGSGATPASPGGTA